MRHYMHDASTCKGPIKASRASHIDKHHYSSLIPSSEIRTCRYLSSQRSWLDQPLRLLWWRVQDLGENICTLGCKSGRDDAIDNATTVHLAAFFCEARNNCLEMHHLYRSSVRRAVQPAASSAAQRTQVSISPSKRLSKTPSLPRTSKSPHLTCSGAL